MAAVSATELNRQSLVDVETAVADVMEDISTKDISRKNISVVDAVLVVADVQHATLEVPQARHHDWPSVCLLPTG